MGRVVCKVIFMSNPTTVVVDIVVVVVTKFLTSYLMISALHTSSGSVRMISWLAKL